MSHPIVLLVKKEIAFRYGVTPRTIDNWCRYSGFPYAVARRRMFDPLKTDDWFRRRSSDNGFGIAHDPQGSGERA